MVDCDFNDLALSIIEMAVEDYKLLKEMGANRLYTDKCVITKKELEQFFNSKWCDYLLKNMDLTGKDILRHLNRE